jgi:hypothetical protein
MMTPDPLPCCGGCWKKAIAAAKKLIKKIISKGAYDTARF